MKSNIDGGVNQSLSQIFKEIQSKLHDSGKQQTINIFNNGTDDLKLLVNTDSTKPL